MRGARVAAEHLGIDANTRPSLDFLGQKVGVGPALFLTSPPGVRAATVCGLLASSFPVPAWDTTATTETLH